MHVFPQEEQAIVSLHSEETRAGKSGTRGAAYKPVRATGEKSKPAKKASGIEFLPLQETGNSLMRNHQNVQYLAQSQGKLKSKPRQTWRLVFFPVQSLMA